MRVPNTAQVILGGIALTILAGFFAVLPSGTAQEPPAAGIEAAIRSLGAADDKEADRAAETLRGLAFDAEPFLLKALPNATGSKRIRIEGLLKFFGHVTNDELLALGKRVRAAILAAKEVGDLDATVRREVESFAYDHVPPRTRTHSSSDGTIIICIGRGGKPGEDGDDVQATDPNAKLVIAIGGHAGARQGDAMPRAGSARASAASGIAIAVGGRGTMGGGAGGDAGASAPAGEVGIGGDGGQGTGMTRTGARGAGSGVSDLPRLQSTVKGWHLD